MFSGTNKKYMLPPKHKDTKVHKKMNKIQNDYKIGLIGCGKMGINLFNYLTGFSFKIIFVCKSSESVEKIMRSFKRKTDRTLKLKLISKKEYDLKLSNTVITQSLSDLNQCDMVIESITEDRHLKTELYTKLDTILPANCIIATNSSSISPRELIINKNRSGKILGLHFFYPVSITNLVEINSLKITEKATIDFVKRFLQKINKFYLLLPEESDFLINKLFLKLQAGCCILHQNYDMSFLEIDTLIKKRLFPIGIFEFFDHVGIDVMLYSVNNYINDLPDKEFYKPLVEELENLVLQGKLGVKTKEGFYNYKNTEPKNEKINNSINAEKIMNMIYSWYLEPVFEIVEKGICTREEIEHIIEEYMNAHQSPFNIFD
ncbi:MAG: hypothetical protein B6D61_14045 [Bacteroidetes bacterium 4484_249]|nr:MAG: hypothetical protein B6D61_14045 [Bacteroidetes bacterium 4484_249]